MTNPEMEAQVVDKLKLDPRIPAAEAIAVTADEGAVTLRGSVHTFAQRRAAVADARQVEGVDDVFDELDVRLLDSFVREDADIRGAALQALMWDVEIPAESIDVRVEDGWVSLSGQVDFQYQSENAFNDVARLKGVRGVINEIQVVEIL
jgi:osmotically-inducible protein OsmY